jgi:hypothetical protein
MRLIVTTAVCFFLTSAGVFAQSGGGSGGASGGGSSGGAAGGASRGGGASAATPAAPSGSVPGGQAVTPGTSSMPTAPGAPAPGVANTPTDPQRNNVDANPPTRRLPPGVPARPDIGTATNPGPSGTPAPGRGQPGAAASRPGAARSANSDGYAECMAMWSPDGTRMSREAWSTTCNQTRLPPRN